MEEAKNNADEIRPLPSRPFLLSMLCIFSVVFYGIVATLFLLALFFSGWISEVIRKYSPEQAQSKGKIFVFILAGFLLHAGAVVGINLMWRLKRSGYYLFGLTTLVIASYQLFQTKIAVTTTGLYILLVILFGIFFKRMR